MTDNNCSEAYTLIVYKHKRHNIYNYGIFCVKSKNIYKICVVHMNIYDYKRKYKYYNYL